MSLVVEELIDGRQVTFTRGAYRNASRVFLVYDSAGADVDVSQILPNSQLPDVGWMQIQGAVHPTLPFMTAQGASISAHTDRKDAYLVTIKYERLFISAGSPDDAGYLELSVDISSEFRDVWRTDAALASGGEVESPTENDIGGTAIDIKGEPVSVIRPSMSIEITQTIDYPAPLMMIQAMAGTRNELQWGIWQSGTVLYEGARISSLGNSKNKLIHTFHYDEQKHLRQVAVPDFTGSVALNSGTAATYALKAFPVIWRQPFPNVSNFSALAIDEALQTD